MVFDHRTYNRERYQRLRAGYVAMLGGKCVDCGTTEDLQFDHIDPATKSFAVGMLLNYAQERVVEELKKCELRCKPCHIEKGKRNGDQGQVEHGGGLSGRHRCKCELCRARKAAYIREWRRVNGRRKTAGIPGVD